MAGICLGDKYKSYRILSPLLNGHFHGLIQSTVYELGHLEVGRIAEIMFWTEFSF
jgi:hypothetical protein